MKELIYITLFVIVQFSHCTTLSPIDKIIASHYEENSNRKFEFDLKEELSKDNFLFKDYKCPHDSIVGHWESEQLEMFHSLKKQRTQDGFIFEHTIKQEVNTDLALTHIRFYVNTTLLEDKNDEGRACYNVGDVVQLGIATPDQMCNENRIDNCYYTCQQADLLTLELQEFLINSVIKAVLDIYKNILEVYYNPQDDVFVLNREFWNQSGRSCYYGIPVPEILVSEGIANVDYAVFMTARPTGSSGTVAYAVACNFVFDSEGNIFRPSAGTVNFVPRHFETNLTPFQFRGVVRVGIHEFAHALGFSGNLFPFFRDVNGQYYPSATEIQTVEGNGVQYNISKIITPRVVEFSKRHFDCTQMNGFELESSGGAGTAGSHWDKRIGGDEFMTGFVNPLMPITDLTLSLFADSGFYVVDYGFSENFEWGKGLGCSFSQGRCEHDWNFPYFCSVNGRSSCTPQKEAKGTCQIYKYGSPIPVQYQRFPNMPAIGGIAPMDFCPTVFGTSTGFCIDMSQKPNVSLGEIYGPESMCFETNLNGASIPTCYEAICTENNLQLSIFGEIQNCPVEGGQINVQNISVTCPTFQEICQKDLYLSQWPSFDSIIPYSGERYEGIDVVIVGENFNQNLNYEITLGGVSLKNIKIINSNRIEAKTGNSCNSEEGPLINIQILETSSGRDAWGFGIFEFEGPTGKECEDNAPNDKSKKITALQIALIVLVIIFGIATLIGCTILAWRFYKRANADYIQL